MPQTTNTTLLAIAQNTHEQLKPRTLHTHDRTQNSQRWQFNGKQAIVHLHGATLKIHWQNPEKTQKHYDIANPAFPQNLHHYLNKALYHGPHYYQLQQQQNDEQNNHRPKTNPHRSRRWTQTPHTSQ